MKRASLRALAAVGLGSVLVWAIRCSAHSLPIDSLRRDPHAPGGARISGAHDPHRAALPTLDASGLAAAYRHLPACRMRITIEGTVRGETEKAKATLLFRRPEHLRIDWE